MNKQGLMMTLLLLVGSLAQAAGLYPVSGWYWNPDKPGTGFNIKLQRGSFKEDGWIFAAGYVYDEAGNPTFITLQGAYQPYSWQQIKDADGQYIGSMSSEAYVSTGGQCIGCPYTPANTQADNSLGPVELRFTDLDAVEIRFRNDTWNLQVMDWHDDPPLAETFDPIRSKELREQWYARGVAVLTRSYLDKYKSIIPKETPITDPVDDWLYYVNYKFYEMKYFDDTYGAGTWPEETVAFRLDGCNWIDKTSWNKNEAMDVWVNKEGSCLTNNGSSYAIFPLVFKGPDGKLWFSTSRIFGSNVAGSDPEAELKSAQNLFADYGGVVGRLYTSRNDFIAIGLYKASEFFPSRMGMEMVLGTQGIEPKTNEIKATYIHWYRGTLDPERYGDGDLVPDVFWETGSIFGDPWQP